jgi:hypothetical protein
LEDKMLGILDFYREVRALVHHGIKAHRIAILGNVTTVAAQAILRETAEALRKGMTIGDQLVINDRLLDLTNRELRRQNRVVEIL